MKKFYEAPEAEIEKLLTDSVVSTSTVNTGDNDYDDPFGDGAF